MFFYYILIENFVLGKFKEIIMGSSDIVSPERVLNLLLHTSDLEYKLKVLFQKLLDTKEVRRNKHLSIILCIYIYVFVV